MELWDVLDENGNFTGNTIQRGSNLLIKGEFHLVVHIWIYNKNKEFLIQKRPEHLAFAPGVWAPTGGSVISGEDSLDGAIREVQEELGILIDKAQFVHGFRLKREYDFTDVWFAFCDREAAEINYNKHDVEEIGWVSIKVLKEMVKDKSFIQYDDEYLSKLYICADEIFTKKNKV